MEHKTELESKLLAAERENDSSDIGGSKQSQKRPLAQDEDGQGRKEEKTDDPKRFKGEKLEVEVEQDSQVWAIIMIYVL